MDGQQGIKPHSAVSSKPIRPDIKLHTLMTRGVPIKKKKTALSFYIILYAKREPLFKYGFQIVTTNIPQFSCIYPLGQHFCCKVMYTMQGVTEQRATFDFMPTSHRKNAWQTGGR